MLDLTKNEFLLIINALKFRKEHVVKNTDNIKETDKEVVYIETAYNILIEKAKKELERMYNVQTRDDKC